MASEIVKWWNNKWAVLIMVVGVLTVGVGFLFAYFISWGWILSILTAIGGGIGISVLIDKMITDYAKQNIENDYVKSDTMHNMESN
jgi:zinc transporter ZupT